MKLGIAAMLVASQLVAVTGHAVGSDTKGGKVAKKDLDSRQGTWVMVGREALGKKATKEDLEKVKGFMVIEENKETGWPEELGKKGDIQEATITLDPAAKPKAIDKKVTKGPGKGEPFQGI